MFNLVKNTPQISVVLASLILWVSFAWGLPAEAGEVDAKPATEDPWAGVRLSDAYDYAKCPKCGMKNEIQAESCSRCLYEFPQPSPLMTDPAYVFVPGQGYYPEGTLLEPGNAKKALWVTGLILAGAGAGTLIALEEITSGWESPGYLVAFYIPALIALGTGTVLTAVGFATRSEPVYALKRGTGARVAVAGKALGPLAVAVKIEMPVLSF
jgi:hypothetical protein